MKSDSLYRVHVSAKVTKLANSSYCSHVIQII